MITFQKCQCICQRMLHMFMSTYRPLSNKLSQTKEDNKDDNKIHFNGVVQPEFLCVMHLVVFSTRVPEKTEFKVTENH